MKLLKIVFVLSLLALTAFGSAYVEFTPAYHWGSSGNNANRFEPKLALNVWEPLFGGISYDGWAGCGAYPGDGTLWAATTQKISIPLSEKVSVSPGVILRTSASQVPNLAPFLSNSEVNLSVTYELW